MKEKHYSSRSLQKNWDKFGVFRLFIRIFEINLQDTSTRGEKYLSELNISRSFIRIFVRNLQIYET